MLGMKRLPLAILIAAFTFAVLPQWMGQNTVALAQGTFTITVKVTEDTVQGPPISGVSVVLVMNGTTNFNATTDGNGLCVFPGISGSYEVTPSKANYTFNPASQVGANTGDRTLFFSGSQATGGSTVQLTASSYSASEGAGRVSFTMFRSGSTASTATVNYATSDAAGLTNCNVFNGIASSRCDYAVSVGRVTFAVGENSKTISIPVVDDSYSEGNESFAVALSNPLGTTLTTPSTATITINDNDATTGPNPIDQTAFFVRQHYIDFLAREPDPGGFQGWQDVINNCPSGNTTCDRVHVSGGFFQSPEFQQRGYFVYRFYPVAIGRKPDYAEFIPDLASVSGFLSDAELEAARVAFVNDFMTRPNFVTAYNGLNNAEYVDKLLLTAQVNPHPSRDFWVTSLGNGTRTRAQVLREIAESTEVYNKYFNQAFVVMQYFGYLRRDPDALYLAWIDVLNSTGESRGMITGFVNSQEYRLRFGP